MARNGVVRFRVAVWLRIIRRALILGASNTPDRHEARGVPVRSKKAGHIPASKKGVPSEQ
jgi:hypothetical protein